MPFYAQVHPCEWVVLALCDVPLPVQLHPQYLSSESVVVALKMVGWRTMHDALVLDPAECI